MNNNKENIVDKKSRLFCFLWYIIYKLYNNFLLLFQRCCVVCHNCITTNNKILCSICEKKIEYIGEFSMAGFNAFGYMIYNDVSHKILMEIKYGRNFFCIKTIADEISKRISQLDFFQDNEEIIFIPIPSYWLRVLERGYNPVEVITREIVQYLTKFNIKCKINTNILKKMKNKLQKNAKDYKTREHNAKSSYKIIYNDNIKDKKIVIVDDMITSGSTMYNCVSLFLPYTEKIFILSIASSVKYAMQNNEIKNF